MFLAGASGGVYAILAAHLADLIMNWAEMELAVVRLLFLLVLAGTDVGVAIYGRYSGTGSSQVGRGRVWYLLAGTDVGVAVYGRYSGTGSSQVGRGRVWYRGTCGQD